MAWLTFLFQEYFNQGKRDERIIVVSLPFQPFQLSIWLSGFNNLYGSIKIRLLDKRTN